MALALTRPSVVVQQNIVAPAALSVENDDNASDDSTSSDSSSSSNEAAPNAEAIYQSYIDQMSDSITATVTVTSTMIVPAGDAAATDFKVAAVVPVQSSAPGAVTPDAAAIYNSYVAQMNSAAASAS